MDIEIGLSDLPKSGGARDDRPAFEFYESVFKKVTLTGLNSLP